MNSQAVWIHLPVVEALGWALIHFLWEGAAIALALAAILPICRSARMRYGMACAAMLAMLAAFGVTVSASVPQELTTILPRHATAVPAGPDAGTGVDRGAPADLERLAGMLPWAVPVWMTGVLLVGLYRLGGWMAAQRMRRQGVCAAPTEWQARLTALARRMGILQPLVLLESSLAEGPLTMGLVRPVILLPAGLLAGLPPDLLEAILLHELAHIRRLDYLVNLLQTLVESLLFYHPAVWWVSGVMRAERESCCDDAAVAIEGDVSQYAAALVTLEERRSLGREPALSAAGGSLMRRIRRLLDQPEQPRAAAALILSMGFLLTLFCFFAMAQQSSQDQSKNPPTAPETGSRPVAEKQNEQRAAALRKELATPYLKWLNEDVAYIITNQERAAFRGLQTDQEREKFIEQFWLKRDPTPGTPENEFQEEHYRRIAFANQHFAAGHVAGWKTDRGRIYIVYGPPDEIDDHPSGGTYKRPPEEGGGETPTYPFQDWRYRRIEGIGSNIIVEFVDPHGTGEYHMTKDPNAKELHPVVRGRAQ